MAWDALAGQFQKKKEDDAEVRQTRLQSGGVSSSGGVGTTAGAVANPTGGFGGTGGSADNSGTSFVNYGTLYGLNEGKAKDMANSVYRGAEKKAEDAKGALGAAQNQFQGKKGQAWNPIGGSHGTRIDDYNPTPETKTESDDGGVSLYGYGQAATGHQSPTQGQSNTDAQGSLTQSLEAGDDYWNALMPKGSTAPGATNAGASRYASLYGAPMGVVQAPDEAGRKDYHHSVDLRGAQSGANQGYGGPDSLKDSMGDEAFAGLQDQFRTADEEIAGLSEAGGIAEALGYGGVEGSGNAAMDAGLTQTAGQSNFKKLQERYGGLGKTLGTAQSDSIADVGRREAEGEAAGAEWDKMITDYEAEQAAKNPKPEDKPSTSKGFPAYDGDGNPTQATTMLEASGYAASELADISNELTPEERAYLAQTDGGVVGDMFNTVFNQANETLKQNILAKLAKARSKKQQGG